MLCSAWATAAPGYCSPTVAGVSLALMSGGSGIPEGEQLLRARAAILGRAIVLLFLAGVLSMIPTTVQVVLASYAFWFVLALPALRWRPRTLLIAACLLALTGKFLVTGLPLWIPDLGIRLPPRPGSTSFPHCWSTPCSLRWCGWGSS